jgi:hypothetical protein
LCVAGAAEKLVIYLEGPKTIYIIGWVLAVYLFGYPMRSGKVVAGLSPSDQVIASPPETLQSGDRAGSHVWRSAGRDQRPGISKGLTAAAGFGRGGKAT